MKKSLYFKILISLLAVIFVLNLLGFIKPFSNFYTDYIYIGLNAFFGVLTAWCPVAIGEIFMYLSAVVLVIFIGLSIALIFLKKKKGFVSVYKHYAKTLLMTFVVVLFLFTINWSIPFRSSILRVSDNTRTSFTFEEILAVRNMIVSEVNKVCDEVVRDENGRLIYDYAPEDIKTAMKNEQGSFGRLAGFYTYPKAALCSPFLDWMGIGGYNYVFTMESTYNYFVAPIYQPVTLSHELVHNKGYYRENEAEFISCIALSRSENAILRYSAYLEMYYYFEPEFKEALMRALFGKVDGLTKEELNAFNEEYRKYPLVKDRVFDDINDSFEIVEELYEEVVDPALEEKYKEVSESVADVGWSVQADVLQENIYSGVTLMLLQYFTEDKNF